MTRSDPLLSLKRKSTIKKLTLLVYALALAVFVSAIYLQPAKPAVYGQPISLELTRGPFTVFEYPSKKPQTKALIIFGSGDLCWGAWEDAASRALQDAGYSVFGIDSEVYAKTDYSLEILQADVGKIARVAKAPFGANPPPLILGGYSMGAEQAVPVAAGPNRPAGVVGLLLVSPGSRGRYGLRTSDQADIPPTGPNTFALSDFGSKLDDLRVVQWHAGLDILDSRAWLPVLTAPHKEYDYPRAFHNYDWANPNFLHQLVASIDWILSPDGSDAASRERMPGVAPDQAAGTQAR